MKKIIFIMIFLISACSTNTKKKTVGEFSNSAEIEKEFKNIENSDFAPVKQVPYKYDDDFFAGKVDKTDSLVKESIAKVPSPKLSAVTSNTKDRLGQIVSLCYQKRFDESKKIREALYSKFVKNPAFWNQTGTCYLLKGDYRKAILYYNKARDLNSKFTPPLNNLGVIYQNEGQDQKAFIAYQKALRSNSFSLTPLFNIAQLYLKYGFVDKAKRYFKSLYDRNPKDSDVLNALGVIEYLSKNNSGALSYFNLINSRDRRRADIAANYALALYDSGRPDDAKDYIEYAQRGLPDRYVNVIKQYVGMR